MNSALPAARRVVHRVSSRPLHAGGRLAAAAVTLLEAHAAGDGWRAAEQCVDPGARFLLASAAASARPGMCWERLRALGAELPAPSRAAVLQQSEPFLTWSDPERGWHLVGTLLGTDAPRAALGLDARTAAADETARAAARGELTSTADPRLAALAGAAPGRDALPSELASLVVAAALVDPAWALERVLTLSTYCNPGVQALEFVAGRAARVGAGAQVLEQARRRGFVADQADWVQAVSAAGLGTEEELGGLVEALAPRVADEVDPGMELIAGLPLLVALTRRHRLEALYAWATDWCVPPPLLADHLLLFARQDAAAVGESPLSQRLLKLPEAGWNTTYDARFVFWDSSDASGSFQDALTVAAHVPWKGIPGTLLDVVFGRRGGAD